MSHIRRVYEDLRRAPSKEKLNQFFELVVLKIEQIEERERTNPKPEKEGLHAL